MNEPTERMPFLLLGWNNPNFDLSDVKASSIVFSNCQIYRSDVAHEAAFWMDLQAGTIGTVALNQCAMQEPGRQYLPRYSILDLFA